MVEERADSPQPGFQEIMAAIAICQATLTNKIRAVQLNVGLVRQDLDKTRLRRSVTEQLISQMEDTVVEHALFISTLQSKVQALEYKVDGAENRNRRKNLRTVGLPEGVEDKNPTIFVEELLRSLFAAQYSPYFTVERAHRISPAHGLLGFPSTHSNISAA